MREFLKTIGETLQLPYRETGDVLITGIAIDSRAVQPGDLFVAIKGENTDGHRYLQAALEKGAAAVAISEPEAVEREQLQNYILMAEGQQFIQQLAHMLRKKSNVPVIAVTGSMGKTSTKDFLEALLSTKGAVVATKGNQNNELGMPLTICRLEENTAALIVEMGMRGLGQIQQLCEIAEPDYGIITCIGTVHCELLGSQENIAKAKCELLPFIPEQGKIVLQRSDAAWIAPWMDTCKGDVIWCDATGTEGQYWATDAQQLDAGIRYVVHTNIGGCEEAHEVEIPVMGLHNVGNSMSAIALARELGVSWEDIPAALANFSLSGMRLKMIQRPDDVLVINDAYNANPESMKSAISVLKSRNAKRKAAALGNMGELGIYEEQGHREAGRFAAAQQLDYLVAVGSLGKLIGLEAEQGGIPVAYADNNQQAVALLQAWLQPGDAVLVKGSRSMQMEEIVQALTEEPAAK